MTNGQSATFNFKGQRYRGPKSLQGSQIIIGSGPSASVRLDDPMIADNHLVVSFSSGQFWVRDLGSTSGTYVNGQFTHQMTPLNEGDSLVFGLTEITTKLDLAQGTLLLEFKPRGFHFDREKDPVRWSKIESKFGVFPGLKLANILGVSLLLLIAFGSFLWPEKMSPGPVSSFHAEAIKKEGGDSCDSCHTPFSGVTIDKCENCHADLMQNSHPFGKWNSHDCTRCHSEHHQGTGSDRFAGLTTRLASNTCGDCHEENKALDPNRPIKQVEHKDIEIAFNTFSHQSHVVDQKIPCSSCHIEQKIHSDSGSTPLLSQAEYEFKKVSFDTCQTCHSPEAPEDKRSKTTFTVNWHGTEEGGKHCLNCHQDVKKSEIKTITRAYQPKTFKVTSRSHLKELEEHSGGQPCSQCHRQNNVGGGRALSKEFLHATHMSLLKPDSPASFKALSEECANCHIEQKDATSLPEGVFTGPKTDACNQCHVDADGTGLNPQVVLATSEPIQKTVNNFPHSFHVNSNHPDLQKGCFTCHTFSDGEGFDRQPQTLDSAKDCSTCHQNHSNIAGGNCNKCHLEGDATLATQALIKKWPVTGNFSHFSKGHKEITEQGAEGCLRCHIKADEAKNIQEVPIPQESDASCRQCHIENKSRFHWR